MEALNVKRPGIEPRASGHIIEQIHLIQQILDAGYAYEVNGSVYFDITKYDKKYHYGILSGRILEDLISSTRTLDGQDEKRNPADFALWKKSQPEHIMRWPSPWSDGFPGWHLECSAMSCKYLGEQFDIHGGGMDLLFPHHESEIAQSQIANHKPPVRYWLHNNMVTINGKKMGKSLGNFITLEQFFTGDHPALERAYTPMTIRFFILQAHYRSTVDFSNEALQASEKGLTKLMAGIGTLEQIKPSSKSTFDIANLERSCYDAMNDDFNSPVLIANLFEGIRIINSAKDGKESLTAGNLKSLKELFRIFITEILGLKDDSPGQRGEVIDGLMNLIMDIRENARVSKDFKTSDKIRGTLQNLNITIKDTRDGATWKLE
jgi:cysteinyl-tRNA synthetase